LRVAQFLANPWQGPCVVISGTNADAIVQAVLDDKRLHLRCTAVLRQFRVERRAGSEASSVMAGTEAAGQAGAQ
jgi:hypothetical protein